MCLTIDPKKHRFWFNHYVPKVAQEDILVYKSLFLREEGYVTGCRAYPVTFTDGIAVLEATIVVEKCPYRSATKWHKDRVIGPGIHSFHTSPFCLRTNFAIIPKGTTFYVGDNNDMVSEKLVIFQFEHYYRDYCTKNQINPKQYE